MRFETEDFIMEIQNRPWLWDTNHEDYSNRVQRQNAWNEIAEIVYDDWLNFEEDIKIKSVQELQKKWKGLRDYYKREKNKSTSWAQKKRKSPLLDMLQFLNLNKANNPETEVPIENDSEDSESSSNTKSKMTNFQEVLLKSVERKRTNDPDMSFLLNILSDMKSMTPSQNFEFRFEVMKAIKKIKYNKNNDSSE